MLSYRQHAGKHSYDLVLSVVCLRSLSVFCIVCKSLASLLRELLKRWKHVSYVLSLTATVTSLCITVAEYQLSSDEYIHSQLAMFPAEDAMITFFSTSYIGF